MKRKDVVLMFISTAASTALCGICKYLLNENIRTFDLILYALVFRIYLTFKESDT